MIINPVMYSGKKLPELDNPGTAPDLLEGKQLLDQYGDPLTGTMPQKSADDLKINGTIFTVPAGYYPETARKAAIPVPQPSPSITIDENGKITSSIKLTAGYTSAETQTSTKQLLTQKAKTVTPGTKDQTAVVEQRFTTGDVIVAGDANLAAENIKSGVSIFGVAGSANTVESVRFGVFNLTSSIAIKLYATSETGESLEETINPGETKRYDLTKGSIVALFFASGDRSTSESGLERLWRGYDSGPPKLDVTLYKLRSSASSYSFFLNQ